MSIADNIYRFLPIWGQNLAITGYGAYWYYLRFGGSYQARKEGYLERESNNITGWNKFREEALTNLLSYSAEKIPYYRSKWNEEQKSAAFRGELSTLPLLEKEPMRSDPYSFVEQSRRRNIHWKFFTSGTTGTPISTLWMAGEIRDAMAVREARSAMWAGVSFDMPRATFSGRLVEPNPGSHGPYYRYNAIERQVYFSAFHLRADTAENYVEGLCRYKIKWMTGYAVSFYLLAKFILEKKLQVPPLKAIITTSEKLTSEMRETIQVAYGCRVYEEYSTVENALFASECEYGKLHVSPDVSVVEILRHDGSACEPGEIGEVVTTCLMRTFQPLIRFRLGDLAAWSSETCGCGRQMPVIEEVVGRIEDVVVGPDGRQLVRFHGIFVNQPHVREGQIIQEAIDKIVVKVVPTCDYDNNDTMDITQRVRQRLGLDISVILEIVEEIPRTKAGKFQSVISKVKL